MSEKPTNVRVAIAIGLPVVRRPGDPEDTIKDPIGWLRIKDYEHDIAAAFGALEAFVEAKQYPGYVIAYQRRTKQYRVIITRAPCDVNEDGDSLPAAITAAILAASEKEAGR